MASRKSLLIAAAAMALVVCALLPVTAFPNSHLVGEDLGWDLNVNYEEEIIPAGDTLEFIYNPNEHNVVLVDENSYRTCVNVPFNAPMWDSGDDFVQLPSVGKYYFICGVGDHCIQGMKITVTAV